MSTRVDRPSIVITIPVLWDWSTGVGSTDVSSRKVSKGATDDFTG